MTAVRPTDPHRDDISASVVRSVGRRPIAALAVGNAFEFFDFTTYAFFAVQIGRAFFPSTTPCGSLLLSVATFGVGFVMRPVGGVVLGATADRLGRKPAMLLSLALMGLGTLALAATPGYGEIGVAAPVIVVLARLIQGFALGGEIGPSTVAMMEAIAPVRRGFAISWQLATQGASAAAAGLIGLTLATILPPDALDAWGWRVPFVLGIAILPFGLAMRARLDETLVAESTGAISLNRTACERRAMLVGLLFIISGTVAAYIEHYLTTYALTVLKLPAAEAFSASIVSGSVTFISALAGGWLADRFGRRPVMLVPRLLLVAASYPAFRLMGAGEGATALLAATALIAALNGVSSAAGLCAIVESMSARARSTDLSIIYAVGVSLFGGTTQFVVTALIDWTGDPLAPSHYLTLASVLGVAASLMQRETRSPSVRSHDIRRTG